MKHDDIFTAAVADCGADLERAWRRRGVVQLGIAFVDRQHEIVRPGESDQGLEICRGRRGALGIGRRAQEAEGRAVEHIGRQCGVIGQIPGRRRRRHEHRLGPGAGGGPGIGGVERVGQQHERRPAGARQRVGDRDLGDQEQALAAAGQRQHLAFGIDADFGQAVAAAQPADDGGPQLQRAPQRRIAAPFGLAFGDRPGDGGRERVVRLAEGQIDRAQTRGRGQTGGQRLNPGERAVAEVVQPPAEGQRHGSPARTGIRLLLAVIAAEGIRCGISLRQAPAAHARRSV